MRTQVKKQKRWHELTSSVPSIPPKNHGFFVPEEEEDNDGNNDLNSSKLTPHPRLDSATANAGNAAV